MPPEHAGLRGRDSLQVSLRIVPFYLGSTGARSTMAWASVRECPLTEALAGRADAMLQLAVVLSLVVVTQRLNDEPVSADRPVLET